jgi:MOSC domain-containing protein YiiM
MAEVISIHRAPVKDAPAEPLAEAVVRENYGLEGDWRSRAGKGRQVTLIEEEALDAVGHALGTPVKLGASRRQVVVRGLPLNPTVGQVLRVGEVELQVTGLADPCDNMERTIGPGARAALDDRGGVCARVLRGGTLRVGDPVRVAELVPAR